MAAQIDETLIGAITDDAEVGLIYIIKFHRPLGNTKKRKGMAQYYVGWCKKDGLWKRLYQHSQGWGSAITRAAARRKIGFDLVVAFPGTRRDERQIKNGHNTPRFVAKKLWERPAKQQSEQAIIF